MALGRDGERLSGLSGRRSRTSCRKGQRPPAEGAVATAQAAYDAAKTIVDSKAIYVGGSGGRDVVSFGQTAMDQIVTAYESYRAEQLDADLLFAAVTDAAGAGYGPESLADLFRTGIGGLTNTATDFVDLQDVEGIQIDLSAPTLQAPNAQTDYATLPYLTPALNGISTGSNAYDNVFYAADYTRMIDDMFGESFTLAIDGYGMQVMNIENFDAIWDTLNPYGKLIHALNGFLDPSIYEGQGGVAVFDADTYDTTTLVNDISVPNFEMLKGKMYLVAGVTYAFSTALEPAEDQVTELFAVMDTSGASLVDANEYLAKNGINQTFVATETGYHDFFWGVRMDAGETAELTYTASSDPVKVAARLLSGEDFVTIERSGLTGAFPEDLPFATRKTYTFDTTLPDPANGIVGGTSILERHHDEIAGEVASGTTTTQNGEIWLEAGVTYTFMVAHEDVDVTVTLAGTSQYTAGVGDMSFVNGEFEFTATASGFQEFSVSATASGFQEFSVSANASGSSDGRFGLYTRTPGVDNDQFWSVLGHTEGRSADLNAGALTRSEIDALGGGIILVGDKRGENLTGSIGHDVVYGADGLDVLDGGSGFNILIGGRGADR